MLIQPPFDLVDTPAFVYDETEVNRVLEVARRLRAETGCEICYSIKPLSLPTLMRHMAPSLDGFAVSSPFEARLARACLPNDGAVHFTSPGIRSREIADLDSLCDYVSFNSLGQWERFARQFGSGTSLGIRVNPGLSFLEDERYDPCRPYSKLGVPLPDLAAWHASQSAPDERLKGILVHSNCESTDFSELEETVNCLKDGVPGVLERIGWINLGGGYLFPPGTDLVPLHRLIGSLRSEYGLRVIMEPGAAFVRGAGFMVSSVLDVLESGGKRVAILDSTVNHMPELLEFDFEPDVAGHDDSGPCEYVLAGCTCLAGDIFGEYRFLEPLETGSRVVFCNVGSYSLTKAHMFNGVNLPSIHVLRSDGRLELVREFGFDDYASRWNAYASSPA